jgi:hypothetical protein
MMALKTFLLQRQNPQKDAPRWVLMVAIATFFLLLIVAGVSIAIGSAHSWIASHSLGILPIGIVWFGALGGSLLSLTGVFKHHKDDWSDSFNVWHALRPWTGLVMGSLGAFFLLVSTELASASAAGVSHAPLKINPDIYYVSAFVVGFVERSFRELVQRLAQSIFGPGNGEQAKK